MSGLGYYGTQGVRTSMVRLYIRIHAILNTFVELRVIKAELIIFPVQHMKGIGSNTPKRIIVANLEFLINFG